MGFTSGVRKSAGALASSSKGTAVALATAMRRRDGRGMLALLSEGSQFESMLRELLRVAFWLLAVAPLVLVPVYYLILTV